MKNTVIETPEELASLQAFEENNFVALDKSEFDELSASLQEAASNTIKKRAKKNLSALDYLKMTLIN